MKKKESKFKSMVSSNAKKQQSQGSSYGYLDLPKGINVFTAEPGGKVTLDIIPYVVSDEKHPDRDTNLGIAVPGELWYKRPFKIHRNIGVAKDSVVCLTSFGKRCPICDYRSKMLKEGSPKEDTDALKPSLRNLYVIIPIGQKKQDAEPMIWDVSQFLFQNLLNDELEENEDNAVFPDLEEGLSLKIRFDSKTIGSGNPFAEASRIDFIERKQQYTEAILEDVPDLDTLLHELTAKEMEVKFMELEDEDVAAEEDDDDNAPVRKKKVVETVDSKPKKKVEEDDDDDMPVRRRKPAEPEKPVKKKPIIEDDDDDDDDDTDFKKDDDDDDDEEVSPKKSVALSKPSVGKDKKRAVDDDYECPYDHVFGEDCEDFEECTDCELYYACLEAKGN